MKCIFRLTLSICILAGLLFGTACTSVDVNAEKALLLKTDIAFSEASVVKGAKEAFHEYLVEDALMLPADSQPIFGREDIDAVMSGVSNSVLLWEPVTAEVSKSGDLGYTWGKYKSLRPGPDGTIRTEYGKYLNVWKKQADGTWKVLVDMGNSNPPLEKGKGEK